jgi:hypothetical protein
MEETKAVACGPTPELVQLLTASQSAMYAFNVSLLGRVMDANELSPIRTFLDS